MGVSKVEIARRLKARIQVDADTRCHVYCGCWRGNGQARMKVGARTYTIQAVVLWLTGRAELWEDVYRYRTCRTPACANPRHIKVAASIVEALRDMRKRKLFSLKGKIKLTRRRRACIRVLLDEGYSVEEIARDLEMRPAKIRRAVKMDEGLAPDVARKIAPRRQRVVTVG